MRRTLVTGASGFVGRHLAETLLARGDSVRVLVKEAGLVEALRDGGAEVHVGDIRDADSDRRAGREMDVVYHCARPSASDTPSRSFEKPTSRGRGGSCWRRERRDVVVSSCSARSMSSGSATWTRPRKSCPAVAPTTPPRMPRSTWSSGPRRSPTGRAGGGHPQARRDLWTGRPAQPAKADRRPPGRPLPLPGKPGKPHPDRPRGGCRGGHDPGGPVSEGERTGLSHHGRVPHDPRGIQRPPGRRQRLPAAHRVVPMPVVRLGYRSSAWRTAGSRRVAPLPIGPSPLRFLGTSRYVEIRRAREELGYVPRIGYRQGLSDALAGESGSASLGGAIHATSR